MTDEDELRRLHAEAAAAEAWLLTRPTWAENFEDLLERTCAHLKRTVAAYHAMALEAERFGRIIDELYDALGPAADDILEMTLAEVDDQLDSETRVSLSANHRTRREEDDDDDT